MNSLITHSVRRMMKLQQPLLLRLRHPRQIRLLEPLLKYGLVLPRHCHAKDIHIKQHPAIQLSNLSSDTAHRILVYLHGGGYAVGSPHTHKSFAARLMQAAGCERAYVPYYRLAPKYPYPTALNDVLGFWQALCERYPNHELVLAGESAGAGSSQVDDPLVSPVHMDVSQLPPLLIQVATHEVFRADSYRLYERCKAQQIDCRLSVWPHLWHAFGLFAPWLPEANQAIQEAGEWIQTGQ